MCNIQFNRGLSVIPGWLWNVTNIYNIVHMEQKTYERTFGKQPVRHFK
jgi:hypothetical protein